MLHQNREQLHQITQLTCQLFEGLGLMINQKKSILNPTKFLGFQVCSNINEPVHSLQETAEIKAGCDGEGGGIVHGEGCCYAEGHPISSTTLSSPPTVNEFCPSCELHSGGGKQEICDSSDTDHNCQSGSKLVGFTRVKPLGNTSVTMMLYSDGALRCIQ